METGTLRIIINRNKDNNLITENDVLINENNAKKSKNLNEINIVERRSELVAEPSEKLDYPFSEESSTNLDEVIGQNTKSSNITRRSSLAGRSSSPESFFNGFFIREEVDKAYVERLKARMDSLKNAQRLKKDNIKKVD